MEFLLVTHTQILMPIKIEGFFENKLLPTAYLQYFVKYLCAVCGAYLCREDRVSGDQSVLYQIVK